MPEIGKWETTAQLTVLTGDITTANNQSLKLVPDGTGIVQIGDAGTTNRGLSANDDLFVSGKFEVDGNSYFDSTALFMAPGSFYDNIPCVFGTGSEAMLEWNTAQTNDALMIGVAVGTAEQSGNVIICEVTDRSVDFGHPVTSNPTLYIQSADATSPSEYIRIYHDQTDGHIECGSGALQINYGGGSVYFFKGTTANPLIHISGYDSAVGAVKTGYIGIDTDGTLVMASPSGEPFRFEAGSYMDLSRYAAGDIRCFRHASTGENRFLYIFGRDAADTETHNIRIRWGDGTVDHGFIYTSKGRIMLRGNDGNDLNTNAGIGMGIPTSVPVSPAAGSMYFDPATNVLYCHNGTAWVGVTLT
jgi:hypothetical protein